MDPFKIGDIVTPNTTAFVRSYRLYNKLAVIVGVNKNKNKYYVEFLNKNDQRFYIEGYGDTDTFRSEELDLFTSSSIKNKKDIKSLVQIINI